MDFFDKLGKTASKTYNVAAEKTTKFAKEAKLKLLISDDKSKIEELYEQIGKKVYEKHVREEAIDIKEELLDECSKIDVLADEIETAREDVLNLKDRKQCDNCYAEIEIDCHYCPNCGARQDEDTSHKKDPTQENAEISETEIENFDIDMFDDLEDIEIEDKKED